MKDDKRLYGESLCSACVPTSQHFGENQTGAAGAPRQMNGLRGGSLASNCLSSLAQSRSIVRHPILLYKQVVRILLLHAHLLLSNLCILLLDFRPLQYLLSLLLLPLFFPEFLLQGKRISCLYVALVLLYDSPKDPAVLPHLRRSLAGKQLDCFAVNFLC
jgi:hypothetical protein